MSASAVSSARTFAAVLWRDLFVTGGTWPPSSPRLLGAFVGAAMGLTLGTLVQPQRINIVLALVRTPLLFTGASQYPWPALSSLRWFQVVTLFNPLTYVSEGLRAALVPDVPHISVWICLAVLVASLVAFSWIGMRGFDRRAVD